MLFSSRVFARYPGVGGRRFSCRSSRGKCQKDRDSCRIAGVLQHHVMAVFCGGRNACPRVPCCRRDMGRLHVWSGDGASVAHHGMGWPVAAFDDDD